MIQTPGAERKGALTGFADETAVLRKSRDRKARFSTAMAIYHLTVSTGSKSAGHSARAKAEYVSREGAYTKDRAELVHVESAHMPAWALVAADGSASPAAIPYWEAADLHERANGRLFKQLEFALPVELPPASRLKLARAFARELTADVDGGQLPYTFAVHAGKGENPHVHLNISERVNDGSERRPEKWFKRAGGKDGGARKTEALKPEEWLLSTRSRWAEITNEALIRAGTRERIDHRSLVDQGIDRVPGVHMGPRLAAMAARGLSPERAELAAVPLPELVRRMDQLEQDYEEISIQIKRISAPRPEPSPSEPASRPAPVLARTHHQAEPGDGEGHAPQLHRPAPPPPSPVSRPPAESKQPGASLVTPQLGPIKPTPEREKAQPAGREFSHARTLFSPAVPDGQPLVSPRVETRPPPSPPPLPVSIPQSPDARTTAQGPAPRATAPLQPYAGPSVSSATKASAAPAPPSQPPSNDDIAKLTPLRTAPTKPLADAFRESWRRAQGLARILVDAGTWTAAKRAQQDLRIVRELLRSGYQPAGVRDELALARPKQPRSYADQTVRYAHGKERQLRDQDKELGR